MRLFNSLRFRLLLTMSIVVLVAVGVIALFTSNSTNNEFQRYVQTDIQHNQQLVSDFLTAYQTDPSTGNLQVIVKGMSGKTDERFIVLESTGYVVADSEGVLVGQTLPAPPTDFIYDTDGPGGASTTITGTLPGYGAGRAFSVPIISGTNVLTTTQFAPGVPISGTLGERTGRLFGFGFVPVVVIPSTTDVANGGKAIPEAVPSVGDSVGIVGQANGEVSLIVARQPRRAGPNQVVFLNSVNQELIVAVVVAGLVALLLTWLLSRRILGPVEALTAAAGRMEKGDLSQRVEVKSHDEIGKLAHAFNSMSGGLSRLEQLRRNMVTDVAHELRTPISNIRGYLEAMQDGVVKPDAEVIESLHEEVMLLSRLVEDLQELELAEAGKLKLVQQSMEPAEVIEKAVTATQPAAVEKEIKLKAELPLDLPQIDADPERIGQVLRNLLNNAIVHTPAGGRVDVAARTQDGEIEVSVKDTGPGISADHLPHIFDRFYRVDQSRTRSTGGAGLGLAIVKELVEMHGGHVRAESTPGHGAAFYFTLPLRS